MKGPYRWFVNQRKYIQQQKMFMVSSTIFKVSDSVFSRSWTQTEVGNTAQQIKCHSADFRQLQTTVFNYHPDKEVQRKTQNFLKQISIMIDLTKKYEKICFLFVFLIVLTSTLPLSTFNDIISQIKGGGVIKASRSLLGSNFLIIHSNDLIFGYCGSIWLTMKHVKFDRCMWPPSSLTPSCLPPFGPFFTLFLHASCNM